MKKRGVSELPAAKRAREGSRPTCVCYIIPEKSIGRVPEWDDQSNPNYYVITPALTVTGGVSLGGLGLRVKVAKRFVDRDALVQLEYAPTARRSIPLWRLQWRPFETHQNKSWGPPGYELAPVRGTHEHRFDHNYFEAESRMRGTNLPAAVPIAPDFSVLSDFIAFCGKRLRIADMHRIRPPGMPPDMFWTPEP